MKFWKIGFVVDTGYEWFGRDCVIVADTEEEARKNFVQGISMKLRGENFVVGSTVRIEEIEVGEFGILYQNCFVKK